MTLCSKVPIDLYWFNYFNVSLIFLITFVCGCIYVCRVLVLADSDTDLYNVTCVTKWMRHGTELKQIILMFFIHAT